MRPPWLHPQLVPGYLVMESPLHIMKTSQEQRQNTLSVLSLRLSHFLIVSFFSPRLIYQPLLTCTDVDGASFGNRRTTHFNDDDDDDNDDDDDDDVTVL